MIDILIVILILVRLPLLSNQSLSALLFGVNFLLFHSCLEFISLLIFLIPIVFAHSVCRFRLKFDIALVLRFRFLCSLSSLILHLNISFEVLLLLFGRCWLTKIQRAQYRVNTISSVSITCNCLLMACLLLLLYFFLYFLLGFLIYFLLLILCCDLLILLAHLFILL